MVVEYLTNGLRRDVENYNGSTPDCYTVLRVTDSTIMLRPHSYVTSCAAVKSRGINSHVQNVTMLALRMEPMSQI